MSEHTVTMTVNGRPRTVRTAARTTLADLLRDDLGLTGTRLGCEQGVCGACTVLLDELPSRACLTLAAACHGSEVTTIEGLHDDDADRLRAAMSREGGLQCGFCTAGMLVSGYDLVRSREVLTRDDVCAALSGNVCRCTGYNGIVRAVQAATAEGIESEIGPDDGAPSPSPNGPSPIGEARPHRA